MVHDFRVFASSGPAFEDNLAQVRFSTGETEDENPSPFFNSNRFAGSSLEYQNPEDSIVRGEKFSLSFNGRPKEKRKNVNTKQVLPGKKAPSEPVGSKLKVLLEEAKAKLRKTEKQNKTFLCSVCGKECVSNKRLKQHKESHKEERLHACKICNLKFKRQTEVTKHMKIHNDTKKFSCQFCQFMTVHKFALSMHLKRHFGDYRFKCDICDKGFYTKFDLTNHTILHSGDRPYECHVCKLTFLYKNNLLYHKKTIHPDPDQPTDCYRCSTCEKTYQCKRSLLAHIQKRHAQKGSHLCELCGQFAASAHALRSHKKKNHS